MTDETKDVVEDDAKKAKAAAEKPASDDKTKAVAKKETTAVADVNAMFEEDAADFEETLGKDDIAIPLLYMIQQMTPMCNKADPSYDSAFEPGLIYDNATMSVYDKPKIIFCAYAACWLEWKPNRGGFAGRHTNLEGMSAKIVRNSNNEDIIQDGSPIGTPGNVLSFTHEHAVLLLGEDGSMMQAILSMSSTQVKHSKKLNTAISKVVNAKGTKMPRFYNVYEAGSAVESNGENSWFSWDFKPVSSIPELGDQAAKVYEAAKAFALAMREGQAQVDYAKPESVPAHDGPSIDGDGEEIPF